MDRFSVSYGDIKKTVSEETVSSCDILDNYRTIVEEYCKVADVLRWRV